MLNKLEVYQSRVVNPPLPFEEAGVTAEDPIQIKNIDGLGPVAAAISSTAYGSTDGEVLNGVSVGKRNIVITFGLNPNWADQTMATLRKALYQYFMPKLEVTLRFHSSHMPVVEIKGVVESMDPPLFAKDPQIQVSIICVKPYFMDVVDSVIFGTTIAINDPARDLIEYSGSVETGFKLKVTSTTAVPDFGGSVQIVNSAPYTDVFGVGPLVISATRYLDVSTVLGDKRVHERPIGEGESINLLSRLSAPSKWLTLNPGANRFAVWSTDPGLSWELTYRARYGGL